METKAETRVAGKAVKKVAHQRKASMIRTRRNLPGCSSDLKTPTYTSHGNGTEPNGISVPPRLAESAAGYIGSINPANASLLGLLKGQG